jgi:hypothetical protein
MFFLTMNFKTLSTPLLWSNDTTNFESVKKLVPKGYVVLTTNMAKQALKYKNDALSYQYQNSQKDSVIKAKDVIIIQKDKIISDNKEIAKIAKRKLFWAEVEKWSLRVLVIYLGGKQLNIIK